MNGKFRKLTLLTALITSLFTYVNAQQWRSLGTVEFTDGWVSPYFCSGHSSVLAVEAQISEDGSLVKLIEPYSSPDFSVVAGTGCDEWGRDRHIVFDISDVSWVTVSSAMESVWFPEGILGDASVRLWVNSRGWYMNALGYDREAVTAAGLNATFSDGKIIVPQAMVSFGAYPDALTQSFGDVAVTSIIDLATAGISAVGLYDISDGEQVRYFTIDGRAVDNIRIPGIYLQCRGSQVYKTVVR